MRIASRHCPGVGSASGPISITLESTGHSPFDSAQYYILQDKTTESLLILEVSRDADLYIHIAYNGNGSVF